MAEGLETLIRLHNLELDQLRREMAALQEQEAKILSAMEDVDRGIASEAERMTPEDAASFDMGAFVAGQLKRKEMLDLQRRSVAEQVIQQQDKIATAFEEVKRYEILRDQRKEAARKAALKVESDMYDEIASIRSARRRAEDAQD